MRAVVVGGGLAGCEAAWALAEAGVQVTLCEQKPAHRSPAHRIDGLAELVCSNSLKAMRLGSAAGLLKAEMERLGSLTVRCAYETQVPAGGALAVDRGAFSRRVTQCIAAHPRIAIRHLRLDHIPEGPAVIATGPLTDGGLARAVGELFEAEYLSFYDAAAPIVAAHSLDYGKVFPAARYGRGEEDDYLNCPFTREEYERFYEALIHAETAPLQEFDRRDFKVYEGCMPVEVMARRGPDTLRYGPLKPVGLTDPRTGRRPWAVVQLRRENTAGSCYNLVGFQTNLKFPEQRRVFSLIPGLEQAEFLRYGVMHRNSFLQSPRLLREDLSARARPELFFAGQLTGVEGYMESAASGILAGKNLARRLKGLAPLVLPPECMIGALVRYITNPAVEDFQPMGANMGLLPPLEEKIRDKQERYEALARRSLAALEKLGEEKTL